MKRFVLSMLALAAMQVSVSPALAQTPAPKTPPTYEQVIVRNWKGIHDKILAMAKDSTFQNKVHLALQAKGIFDKEEGGDKPA